MSGDFIPPSRKLYLTPDAPPEGRFCRQLSIPDTPEWVGLVDGLLSTFAEPETWRQFGDLTPEATAEAFLAILLESWALDSCGVSSDVPAPFWDDPDASDAGAEAPADEQEWYFELGDWALAGFLAATVTPEAAITYITTIKPIVVKLRTGSAGAIANMIVDGTLADAVDTWSNVPGTIDWQYNIPPAVMLLDGVETHELVIEHSGTHNVNATPSGGDYVVEVVRDYLGRNAQGQAVTRINPDTGAFEQTLDGGETWIENPDIDPRRQITFPALTGSNLKCRAAASIASIMQSRMAVFLDALQDGMSIFAAANFVLGLLQFAFFGFPVWSIFYALADGIAGIGVETVEDEMTSSVYEKLRCIFLTLLDADGRMSEANMSRLYSALYMELDAIPAQVLDLLIDGLGFGGLSNFASQDADPLADCGCLVCPLDYFDDMATGIGWRTELLPTSPNPAPIWRATGGYTGEGCVEAVFNSSAGYQMTVRIDLGQDCYVQQLHFLQYKPNAPTSYWAAYVRVYNEAGALTYSETAASGNATGSGWLLGYHRTIGLATGRYVVVIGQGGTPGGAIRQDNFQVVTA